jgi:DNA-binding response OmpR family regulator
MLIIVNGDTTSHVRGPAHEFVPSQANPSHHILVVEDDAFLLQLNTQALSRLGYEVDTATDGAAAWQALSNDSYDLVITDNNMPKVSGVELLKMLRSSRMSLPVIMATGELPEDEFARYPWLRPAATLLKPYTCEEMLRTVKEVLREADAAPGSVTRSASILGQSPSAP